MTIESENYTGKRVGIVIASGIVTYVAYALAHALWPPLGAPAAGAAGYGLGILAHRYWS